MSGCVINNSNPLDKDEFRKEYLIKNSSEEMKLSDAPFQFFKLQLASNSTYSQQNDPNCSTDSVSLDVPSSLVFLLSFDRQSTARRSSS